MRHSAKMAIACFLVIVPFFSSAQDAKKEQQKSVKEAILKAIPETGTNSKIKIGSTKGSGTMDRCQSQLEVSFSGTGPYQSAKVTCAMPRWTFYVPVTIDSIVNVVVARQNLEAGDTISSTDIEKRPESGISTLDKPVFHHRHQLEGMLLLQSVAIGSPILKSQVQFPVFVKSGQQVSVTGISGGVSITITAIALQSGRIGDTIEVRNIQTGKIFPVLVKKNGLIINLND